ncbi:MAG TPA: cellobiose phosphorylase, partial [Anaerolineae bacterium]|nr:cellobiose phosphorylase [Anaerolineae bacterium]
ASFGVESKDQPIVEFQPANKAYQLTPYLGFRTFLKIGAQLYEPFAPAASIDRRMFIGMNELELQEINQPIGLQINVVYFTVPQENFAGLVRQVTFKNISHRPLHAEVLDGLPAVIPYGVNNAQLKEIGRTVEAWMEVFNLDQDIPFYRVRASVADSAEVEAIEAGHFAVAFIDRGSCVDQLPALVDPNLVFDQNTALSTPDRFCAASLAALFSETQIVVGKTPCAFFGSTIDLQPDETITLYGVYGHVSAMSHLPHVRERVMNAARLKEMRCIANSLTQQLTDVIETRTSDPVFDAYCRQTFLDNVLRGGWPRIWGKNVYHLYSRKHGDLERDYNAFLLSAEYYSQGNGAYRDVNQNRRSDVLFEPRVGDFNIRSFMSLIQADGYNPLVIQGSSFTLSAEQRAVVLKQAIPMPSVDAHRNMRSTGKLEALLSQPFTPGKLLKFLVDHGIQLSVSLEDFLAQVMSAAAQHLEAKFGEGYWIDHWTYNLDLIESYLAIYPDQQHALLFESALPFFDSPTRVQPRCQKYVLANGQPRQFNAVIEDQEKAALMASRHVDRNWLRIDLGRGAVYRTTLFNKLVMLMTIKFATLDPFGMGIELEAGRPGWYDALNGLPGLLGSSLNETCELLRLIQFLQNTAAAESIELPHETADMLHAVLAHLKAFHTSTDPQRDFIYWDAVSTVRENYRAAIRLGLSGETQTISKQELADALALFAAKLRSGVQRALDLNHGLPPTYFTYRVEDYELIRDAAGQPQTDAQERTLIRVKSFTPQVLPLFLEGLVHAFKVVKRDEVARLYRQVKASPLFDRELKMYKVNASLADQPHDIGRARAFVPGWLENESIWLHMEYKYLLEVLRAGLYEEFLADFKFALIPFLDPHVYGRSPLENSSFLVSSAHPDRSLHGTGFVARLSGSTAEFLSIWQLMFSGPRPFVVNDGELQLKFQPALPEWLFAADDTISFKFLGQCIVTIHNPHRRDTFVDSVAIRRMRLVDRAGSETEIAGGTIGAPWAARTRSGDVVRIDLFVE